MDTHRDPRLGPGEGGAESRAATGPVDDGRRTAADNAGMTSKRAGPAAQAAHAAEQAIRTWQGLAERLTPIIGEQGFRVLYLRSMHLTRADFPSLLLPPPQSDAPEPFFASLRQSLEVHPALAAQAHSALLVTFTGLLNSLIGEVLTARLVQEAPPDGSTDERPQEFRDDR